MNTEDQESTMNEVVVEPAVMDVKSMQSKLMIAQNMRAFLNQIRGRTNRTKFYGRKTGTGFGGTTKQLRIQRQIESDRQSKREEFLSDLPGNLVVPDV